MFYYMYNRACVRYVNEHVELTHSNHGIVIYSTKKVKEIVFEGL